MNHAEQRRWLIRQLLDEEPKYKDYSIPNDTQDQKNMLRALMNVRLPKPISEEYLAIQDEYLTSENTLAGITEVDDLSPTRASDRIYLWQGDITTLKTDAIVNAANSGLTGCYQPLHNCIDNIIGSKAGIGLRNHLGNIMDKQGHPEPTGQAKITPGFNLPCKYIIHTVGPIVQGRLTKHHEEQLASCYRSCLKIADENDIKSIAFCCISTGVFMFPNQRAAEIAVATVKDYLKGHDGIEKVVFNVFKDMDLEIYDRLLNQ